MSLGSEASAFFGAAGAASGGVGYEISRSLRFNSADSAYLNRLPGSAGNRKTWTWAGWVKRGSPGYGSSQALMGAYVDGSNFTWILLGYDDVLYFYNYTPSGNIFVGTSSPFRDYSAWYHIVVVYDIVNGTQADRVRFYVNGVRQAITSAGPATTGINSYFSFTTAQNIGREPSPDKYFNGYLADVHFIDGQALDPTSFGEFDANGIWQPIAYSDVLPGPVTLVPSIAEGALIIKADDATITGFISAAGFVKVHSSSDGINWTYREQILSGSLSFSAKYIAIGGGSTNSRTFNPSTGGSYTWAEYSAGTQFDTTSNITLNVTGLSYTPNSTVRAPYGTNGFHLDFADNSTAAALGTDVSGNGNDWTVNNITPNTGGLYVYSNYYTFTGTSLGAPEKSFDLSEILTFVDASGAITNGAWSGTYVSGSGTLTWTPANPVEITSSLEVYAGAYDNTPTSYTITVTYTDASTEVFTGTSGSSNWVKRCITVSSAGKSLESIVVSSSSYPQLNAVRVDNVFLSNLDTKDNDSHVDVPTNGTEIDTGVGGEVRGNYPTWSTIDKYLGRTGIVVSNGSLDVISSVAGYQGTVSSTIPLPRFGKWYWEIQSDDGTFTNMLPGLQTAPQDNYGGTTNGFGLVLYQTSGVYIQSPFVKNGNPTWTAGAQITDVYGFAVDMDEGNFYLYYNGVVQNGGDAIVTNILDETKPIYPAMTSNSGVKSYTNFGQSRFVYPAPTGYKALCSTNIAGTPFITSGTYIGNGNASGPVVFTGGVPLAVTVGGTPISFGTNADKLSGGFKIRTASSTFNLNANSYSFSVTSTGDPVDKARAQTN